MKHICTSLLTLNAMLLAADVHALEIDTTMSGQALPVSMAQQRCVSGHRFSAIAGLLIGYDSNTRPPAETIRPDNGPGPGGGGPGPGSGGGPAILLQPLVDTSQSDTYLAANAMLRHAYCLTSSDDEIAILWVNRAGVTENRYLNLDGADEQSINLSSGALIAADWFWRVSPAVDFSASSLEGQKYRQRIGLSSHQQWDLAHNWQLGFRIAAGRVEYDQVPDTLHVEGDDRSLFAETSYLLSPLYRMKFGFSIAEQSTDDDKLSYDTTGFQLELSRYHPLHCDAWIRYRVQSEKYVALATSGDPREDDETGIELGACMSFRPGLKYSVSAQRNVSDSNEVEFDYTQTQFQLAMEYQF